MPSREEGVMKTAEVERHYGSAGIAERVLAAFRAANGPDAPVTPEGLAPFDHFHGRGVAATQELAAARVAARRTGSRYRFGYRRAGPLVRRGIRRAGDRGRFDARILRGRRGAE